jgi:hypothetical protein
MPSVAAVQHKPFERPRNALGTSEARLTTEEVLTKVSLKRRDAMLWCSSWTWIPTTLQTYSVPQAIC